ncbi:cdkn1a interacting zinc finger protein 1b [Chanos chanos]|uniref:Cdkn1a interacting zinc finger protein 1b n=1 Tax=Chanos chanos TaxID=29144 RepID=A0A6J2WTT0_CHACN|nr:uncharacterized protein LOC115827868 [Chanos chanos]
MSLERIRNRPKEMFGQKQLRHRQHQQQSSSPAVLRPLLPPPAALSMAHQKQPRPKIWLPNRPVTAGPAPCLPMINYHSTAPGNLLNPNPVMQRALLRQHVLVLSLLLHIYQDTSIQFHGRQGENEQAGSGGADWQMNKTLEGNSGKVEERIVSLNGQSVTSFPQQQGEPPLKKQKMNGSEESVEDSRKEHSGQNSNDSHSLETSGSREDGGSLLTDETVESLEPIRAAEVLGVGTSLKVTIQQSSESRAFSTGPEGSAGPSGPDGEKEKSKEHSGTFHCYTCKVTCLSQQDFQCHMSGVEHQQRMTEIQHMSNACLSTLLPYMQETLQGTHRHGERREGVQRWCAVCQNHFSGDLIEHRRTKEHKMSKHSSRPFCTVCERHFRTPRKFVEHMKSPEHKQRVEELREEGEPEILEELITVDAVGCFEGEDGYEEEHNEEEEEGPAADNCAQKEMTADVPQDYDYDSDTQLSASFVVPVAGFLCQLCHKFFHFESTARESHCKSLMHIQNLQRYKAMKIQGSTTQEDAEKKKKCSNTMEELGEPGTKAVCSEGLEHEPDRDKISQSDPKSEKQTSSNRLSPDSAVVIKRHTCVESNAEVGSTSNQVSLSHLEKRGYIEITL